MNTHPPYPLPLKRRWTLGFTSLSLNVWFCWVLFNFLPFFVDFFFDFVTVFACWFKKKIIMSLTAYVEFCSVFVTVFNCWVFLYCLYLLSVNSISISVWTDQFWFAEFLFYLSQSPCLSSSYSISLILFVEVCSIWVPVTHSFFWFFLLCYHSSTFKFKTNNEFGFICSHLSFRFQLSIILDFLCPSTSKAQTGAACLFELQNLQSDQLVVMTTGN